MSLALSLFYIFQIFAVSGVKTLLIREVAKDRSQTRKYFVNGCLIVGVMSLASLAGLFGFVRAVDYTGGTKLVVLLLSLGLFPYAISADRKSTRLNSSHQIISYAVFCLKKKNKHT